MNACNAFFAGIFSNTSAQKLIWAEGFGSSAANGDGGNTIAIDAGSNDVFIQKLDAGGNLVCMWFIVISIKVIVVFGLRLLFSSIKSTPHCKPFSLIPKPDIYEDNFVKSS